MQLDELDEMINEDADSEVSVVSLLLASTIPIQSDSYRPHAASMESNTSGGSMFGSRRSSTNLMKLAMSNSAAQNGGNSTLISNPPTARENPAFVKSTRLPGFSPTTPQLFDSILQTPSSGLSISQQDPRRGLWAGSRRETFNIFARLDSGGSSSVFSLQGHKDMASSAAPGKPSSRVYKIIIASSLRTFDTSHKQTMLNTIRRLTVSAKATGTELDESVIENIMTLYYFVFGIREFSKESAILGERVERVSRRWWLHLPRFLGKVFGKFYRKLRAFKASPVKPQMKRASDVETGRTPMGISRNCSIYNASMFDNTSAYVLGRGPSISNNMDFALKSYSDENELFSKFKDMYETIKGKSFRKDSEALHNCSKNVWRHVLHQFTSLFEGRKVRHATKVAAATSFVALLLLMDRTKVWAQEHNLHWTLNLVCVMLENLVECKILTIVLIVGIFDSASGRWVCKRRLENSRVLHGRTHSGISMASIWKYYMDKRLGIYPYCLY